MTLTREGTEQGVILGTASYMSPEQARGKSLDRRTDIWSFGCVFYEALTGRKAFSGETVSDILAAVLEKEPDWTVLPARTPVKIRDLLRWCLQKDPHRRLRDIGDARIEIDEPSKSPVTVLRHRYLPWAVVQPISETRRVFEDPRLSPDGRRLAVTIRDKGSRIWVYEIARDILTSLSLGLGQEEVPVWTPDGSRLVFMSGSPPNLFWQGADGSGDAERLTTSDQPQLPTSWSPDGKVLVFHQRGRRGDIWLLTLDGERKAQPLLQTPFGESGGVLSPDGRFLAYHSTESGKFEVFVRAFQGAGEKWQISNDGGRQPVWARNGREIFYRNGDKMMAAPVGTEPAFHVGRPIQLFEKKFAMPEVGVAEYDVALDGEHFVMLQDTETWPTQIHVVQNWHQELLEKVPVK